MFRKRSLDESRIIRRVLRGHTNEFGQLVEAYLPTVHAVAYAILGNHADAEDAAQESFIGAYKALDTLRETNRFGSWLTQITRNTCLTQLKTRIREEKRVEQVHATSNEAQQPVAGSNDLRETVQRAIMEVDEDVREVIMLYYFAEKDSTQIAELLGISSDAVRKRLQRAREVLRDRLESEIGPALRREKSGKGRTSAIMAIVTVSQPAWRLAPTLASRITEAVANTMGGSGAMKAAIAAAVVALGIYAGLGPKLQTKMGDNGQIQKTSTESSLEAPSQPMALQADKSNNEVDSQSTVKFAQAETSEVGRAHNSNTGSKPAESQLGGNPQHTNFVDLSAPLVEPAIVWSTPIGDSHCLVGPCPVRDGMGNIYVNYSKYTSSSERENFVVCFDASGRKTWISDPIKQAGFSKSIPAISGAGELIYGFADGIVRALDRDNGLVKWSTFITSTRDGIRGGVTSSPLVDSRGDFYVGGRHFTGFFKFDSAGKTLWEIPLPEGANLELGVVSSPALSHDGRTVYFSRGERVVSDSIGNGIYALDAKTGAIKWHYYPDDTKFLGVGYPSPSIGADGTIYVQDEITGTLYAIEDAGNSAKLKWTFIGEVTGDCARITATDGSSIFVGASNLTYTPEQDTEKILMLYSLTLDGTVKWSHKFDGAESFGIPVVTRDAVYMTVDGIGLQCLDKKDGSLLWDKRIVPRGNKTPDYVIIGPDSTLYFLVGGTLDDPNQPALIALK
jgi:RNA polymerase sigma-70 factor (ECF subfamily)